MLDEILLKVAGLPKAQQDELAKVALEATEHMAFIPLPGPQTEAYLSEADVLLFGGSPGGGKTALEIGLALNCHRRSIIARKEFVDLEGPLHTLDNILGVPRSATQGNRPKYRSPNGCTIDFIGLGDDLGGKQGNPHDLICVGKDTLVLMADGGFKEAQRVQEGDYVTTLSGTKRVMKAFATPVKKAVRVTLPNGASQVQSASHKVLSTAGWVDHRGYVSSRLCETCAPKGYRRGSTLFGRFYQKGRGFLQLLSHRFLDQRPACESGQAERLKESRGLWLCAERRAQPDRGNEHGGFGGRPPRSPPQLLSWAWTAGQQLLACVRGVWGRNTQGYVCAYGESDAQKKIVPPGYRDCCFSCFHPYDAHTHGFSNLDAGQGGAAKGLLLLVDVGQRNPSGLPKGDADKVHRCSRHTWWYDHPYKKGRCQSSLLMRASACEVSPVGDVELFDLEIEEDNHFITLGGFVNKNCIDEAAQIPEVQFRMLLGWLRPGWSKEGQRCRVVLGSNPPLDNVGDWLIAYFAPWLDPQNPNPAQEGELRYFLPSEKGGDRECRADEFVIIQGVRVTPQSRTFISSKFTDNPYYNKEQYAKSLAGLPDTVRDRLISGDFMLARQDDAFQAIPTAWVREAQGRWTSTPPVGVPMCAIGVDVAQGGSDRTVLAPRHDGWFDRLIAVPGAETPDGKTVAGLVVKHRRNEAKPIVDIGGGWGGDAYAALRENGIDAVSYMGVKPSLRRTQDQTLKFFNTRSEAYWRFREALDPSQEQGSSIMLPPDAEMVADLCAPMYEVVSGGIKIESKEKVCARLGRSTDKGDAVIMAWFDGLKGYNIQDGWSNTRRKQTKVNLRR